MSVAAAAVCLQDGSGRPDAFPVFDRCRSDRFPGAGLSRAKATEACECHAAVVPAVTSEVSSWEGKRCFTGVGVGFPADGNGAAPSSRRSVVARLAFYSRAALGHASQAKSFLQQADAQQVT